MEKTFKELALGFSKTKQDAMVAAIRDSLDRRQAFEAANGGDGGSWRASKKLVEGGIVAVSQFFLALGVKPAAVFERQIVEGKMLNAKSIKKIVEMAKFAVGAPTNIERVIRAFIACALIANDKTPGDEPIVFTNAVNAKFLNRQDLSAHIKDADLLADMEEARHTAMSTGAATQSSQMRNVLDVLGLGQVRKVERERDAVVIDPAHPFYDGFRQVYLTKAAA